MNRYKQTLKSMYVGRLSVSIFDEEKLSSGETVFVQNVLFDDIPCKLSNSYRNYRSFKLKSDNLVNKLDNTARLFLQPDIIIPIGSKINVLQDDRSYTFDYSGRSFAYPTHQEIIVESYDYI